MIKIHHFSRSALVPKQANHHALSTDLPARGGGCDLNWRQFIGPPPAEPGIDVRVRSQGEDGIFYRLSGEVTNTRGHTLSQLALEARYLDVAGQPLVDPGLADKQLVAAGWLPPFEPGEVRLFQMSRVMAPELRGRVARICLAVLQLR